MSDMHTFTPEDEMKFKKPNCPECGELACRIVEHMLVDMPLKRMSDGTFDYDDVGDVDPGGDPEPLEDAHGRITLSCGEHDWKTRFVDEDVKKRRRK